MAEILTLVSLNYPLRTLLLFFPRPLDSVSDSHSSWTENGETFLVGQSLEEEGSKANRIRFSQVTNSVGRIGNETKQWRREINTRASIFHRGSLDSVVFLVITRRVPIPRLGDTQWNARRCRLTRVIQILPSGPAFRSSLSRCRADRAE